MRYTVSADHGKGYVEVAKFGKRSDAVDFASFHKNVKVIRKTPRTTRTVFSRSVAKSSNGFVTLTETQVFRDSNPTASN